MANGDGKRQRKQQRKMNTEVSAELGIETREQSDARAAKNANAGTQIYRRSKDSSDQ